MKFVPLTQSDAHPPPRVVEMLPGTVFEDDDGDILLRVNEEQVVVLDTPERQASTAVGGVFDLKFPNYPIRRVLNVELREIPAGDTDV